MQVLLLLCSVLAAFAGDPGPQAPRYLFYLHGQIVEGSDGRPEHPQFGLYDYPAIVQAFEDEGFEVISEIREADVDGQAYAQRIVGEVEELLAGGVDPSRISIVGNSKGGAIAVAVCAQLAHEELNYVFTGTCVNWIGDWPHLVLRGRILSIVEATDTVAGSCAAAFVESDLKPEFAELRIETGKGHGAFYAPDPAWFDPAVAWCRGE